LEVIEVSEEGSAGNSYQAQEAKAYIAVIFVFDAKTSVL
jgi:hypothetical protein